MAPHKLLIALAVVAVAVVGALAAVVFLTWDRGGTDQRLSRGDDPIVATGTFAPRAVLFGDTVTATVDVAVDKTVVDPTTRSRSRRRSAPGSPWPSLRRRARTRLMRRTCGPSTSFAA